MNVHSFEEELVKRDELICWEQLVGDLLLVLEQSVFTPMEHAAGRVSHQWQWRGLYVAQHLIRFPSTNQADDVGVHIGYQQHTAARKERAETSVGGEPRSTPSRVTARRRL